MALPAGVRLLELNVVPCAGPLLPALMRFSRLEALTIDGNGADIRWDLGPVSTLSPLHSLRLDYRRPPREEDDVWHFTRSRVKLLPESAPRALAAATDLHTLELRVVWDDDVAKLCRALPSLRNLRCGGMPRHSRGRLVTWVWSGPM